MSNPTFGGKDALWSPHASGRPPLNFDVKRSLSGVQFIEAKDRIRCMADMSLHSPSVTSISISTFDQHHVVAPFRPNARHQLQGAHTRFLGVAAMLGAMHVPHHMPPDFLECSGRICRPSRSKCIGLRHIIGAFEWQITQTNCAQFALKA